MTGTVSLHRVRRGRAPPAVDNSGEPPAGRGLSHLSAPDVARDGTMSRTMMRTDADGSILERLTLLVFPPGFDGDLPLEP